MEKKPCKECQEKIDKLPHQPRVGVGVFVVRDGKFLLGKRKGAHGAGTWSLPGGHLEFGEEWEDCARREVREEAGVDIAQVEFLAVTNDIFRAEDKHYITIFVTSQYDGGVLEIKEPDKCEEWSWFDFKSLPEPIFLPLKNLVEQLDKKKNA